MVAAGGKHFRDMFLNTVSPQVRSTGVHSQEALAGVSSEARQSCLNTAKEILGDFWLFLQTSKSN